MKISTVLIFCEPYYKVNNDSNFFELLYSFSSNASKKWIFLNVKLIYNLRSRQSVWCSKWYRLTTYCEIINLVSKRFSSNSIMDKEEILKNTPFSSSKYAEYKLKWIRQIVKVKLLLLHLNWKLYILYRPSRNIGDESMIFMKPIKRRFKILVAADSLYGYMLNFKVYKGNHVENE